MEDCLFCKIASGQIPSKKLYEDEKVFAFYDIDPQAPVHFLVVPKEHIPSPAGICPQNQETVGHIFSVIARLAEELGLENGYRVVTNCGEDAGQSVQHLHFHVLAKRSLAWPPG
ncbi:MAG: histidine triad nucleotide-binding protein [Oscillospiraceae bacterium]|nr:histidine triad nucleotide-binding protein [Oscillospiraceae bacterium]